MGPQTVAICSSRREKAGEAGVLPCDPDSGRRSTPGEKKQQIKKAKTRSEEDPERAGQKGPSRDGAKKKKNLIYIVLIHWEDYTVTVP